MVSILDMAVTHSLSGPKPLEVVVDTKDPNVKEKARGPEPTTSVQTTV